MIIPRRWAMKGKSAYLAVALVVGLLLALPVSLWAAGAVSEAIPTPTPERSAWHQQMEAWMDAMMGKGFSARMHAAMPGSEQMMEQCAQYMEQQGVQPQHMRAMRGMMMMMMMMMGRVPGTPRMGETRMPMMNGLGMMR
jgi:hypothetical protein